MTVDKMLEEYFRIDTLLIEAFLLYIVAKDEYE